jgi:hypothetical protein
LKQIPEKVPSFLQLRPWLLITSGYFYGIIHEPYMGVVLILVGGFNPSEKYARHLGWWHSHRLWKNMFQTTNQRYSKPSNKLSHSPFGVISSHYIRVILNNQPQLAFIVG